MVIVGSDVGGDVVGHTVDVVVDRVDEASILIDFNTSKILVACIDVA